MATADQIERPLKSPIEGSLAWRPIVVAGQGVEAALHAEREHLIPKSGHWSGCYQSEPLCAWQRRCSERGFRDVELVQSIYGWSVRAGSGMDGFALLAGSRSGALDGTYEDAVRWATKWCADDPERRYAWRRS